MHLRKIQPNEEAETETDRIKEIEKILKRDNLIFEREKHR